MYHHFFYRMKISKQAFERFYENNYDNPNYSKYFKLSSIMELSAEDRNELEIIL